MITLLKVTIKKDERLIQTKEIKIESVEKIKRKKYSKEKEKIYKRY